MNIMSRTRNPRERAENPDTVVRRKGARAKVSPILFRHSCAKTLKAFAPLTSAEKVPLIVVANLPFELTHRSKAPGPHASYPCSGIHRRSDIRGPECRYKGNEVAKLSTLAIVGAGPQLGRAIGRRFAVEGVDVALIARSRTTLQAGIDVGGRARP